MGESAEGPVVRVLAAVIERDGRYLICRRPQHKRHGGLWEFPGGKLEAGETLEQAAARELREELDVYPTAIGPVRFQHREADSPFQIEFVPVMIAGKLRALEHEEMRWATLSQLLEVPLAPSDQAFARYLAQDHSAPALGARLPRGHLATIRSATMTHTDNRSFERITDEDLRRLGRLAAEDRAGLFSRSQRTACLYADRLFAVALCQGAALHRFNGTNGVKDFDVWTFFVANPDGAYPPRRNGTADFGDPKFGKTPGYEHFVGRRVDFLGRSYAFDPSEDVARALRGYLIRAGTESSRFLAAKAVVLIEPEARLGELVWPFAS